MNGTHQILAYVDDVNLIGHDIRTIRRYGDVLINPTKDICLAGNTGKIKYLKVGTSLKNVDKWLVLIDMKVKMFK